MVGVELKGKKKKKASCNLHCIYRERNKLRITPNKTDNQNNNNKANCTKLQLTYFGLAPSELT